MKLHELHPAEGSTSAQKRLGRGAGSGLGKTSGKGHKGAKARSGGGKRPGFEGGQMHLYRRVPKRGFNNVFGTDYAVVNVERLEVFENGDVVDAAALLEKKIIRKELDGVKILGVGELTKKLTVKAAKFSATAKEKNIRMLCGQPVSDISALSKSFDSCRGLRSIAGFHNTKKLYFYEETEDNHGSIVLFKKTIDEIIIDIEKNDPALIEKNIVKLYEEIKGKEGNSRAFDLNINYFLFQLIHLASELDDTVNQEEIIQYISGQTSGKAFARGSHQHMTKFATEFAVYLSELRKNISRGILADVEADIKKNYADNISLKDLGDRYHINSSYLGQVFKKNYGMSFKNYLTNYRIKEAARQIINTDKKINRIAEDVGYKDSDYFIRKFIEIMGCTPSKYRKNNQGA